MGHTQTYTGHILKYMRKKELAIPKVTDIHSEYKILTAFLRLRCLRHRTSILRYTYTACHV
jgi:hypothetical protein